MILSIITINYNNLCGLIKTVNSVKNQSLIDFEFIIIDGGSVDGSVEFIEENQEHVNYWISEKDNGIYHAMNKGIEVAKGEYCLFLNSGDYLFSENSLSNLIQKSFGKDIVYGDIIHEQFSEVYKVGKKLDFKYFLTDTIAHAGALIKRELFKKYGLYNENFKIISDWEFFLKCIVLFNVTYTHIGSIVTIYQSGGISLNQNYVEIQKLERKKVLMKYFANYLSLVNENEFLNTVNKLYFKVNLFKGIFKLVYFKLFRKHFNIELYNK